MKVQFQKRADLHGRPVQVHSAFVDGLPSCITVNLTRVNYIGETLGQAWFLTFHLPDDADLPPRVVNAIKRRILPHVCMIQVGNRLDKDSGRRRIELLEHPPRSGAFAFI